MNRQVRLRQARRARGQARVSTATTVVAVGATALAVVFGVVFARDSASAGTGTTGSGTNSGTTGSGTTGSGSNSGTTGSGSDSGAGQSTGSDDGGGWQAPAPVPNDPGFGPSHGSSGGS